MPRPRRTSIQASTNAARKPSGGAPPQKSARPSPAPAPAPGPEEDKAAAYNEAVRLYERGLQALQRHEFTQAAELLRSVIARYPTERELLDRARVYLKVCERHAQPDAPAPRTANERVYAATLELNAGRPEVALSYLQIVVDEEPDNDHALYMLAMACAQRQDPDAALEYLKRAITLNPDNRPLARTDPEFDGLRDTPEFRTILESGAPPSRRKPRSRPGR